MKELFFTVLRMSAAGGAVYALLKLLALLGGGRLTQGWRYHATLAAAVCFAVPLHKLWALLPGVRVARTVLAIRAGIPALPASVSAAGSGRIIDLAAVWLAVALGLAVVDIVKLARCRRLLMTGAVPAGKWAQEALKEALSETGVRRRAQVYVSPAVQSPMLVGFTRPVILLPERRLAEGELRLILLHELIHFRRLDLWKKLALGLIGRLHWFNPAVYLLCRDVSRLMETACDELVASGLDRDGRREYGYLLINCAPNLRREGAFVSFSSCRKKLERRIETMMDSKKRTHAILGLILALALAIGCVATTALAAGTETKTKTVDLGDVVATFDCSDDVIVGTYDISGAQIAEGDGDAEVNITWYDAATGETVTSTEVVYYTVDNWTAVPVE